MASHPPPPSPQCQEHAMYVDTCAPCLQQAFHDYSVAVDQLNTEPDYVEAIGRKLYAGMFLDSVGYFIALKRELEEQKALENAAMTLMTLRAQPLMIHNRGRKSRNKITSIDSFWSRAAFYKTKPAGRRKNPTRMRMFTL